MCDEFNKRWRQLEPWLQLFHIPGLGTSRYQALLDHYSHPLEVLKAGFSRLRTIVPERVARAIQLSGQNSLTYMAMEKDKGWLGLSFDHHILSLEDGEYPELLKNIHDPPPLLYIKGNIETLKSKQLAVVGSRSPSLAAQQTAREICHDLAATGITITSGLARGIDGAAHQGALEACAQTIGVVACGVDIVYPVRHKKLAQQIQQQGALVSEFPLGTQPKAGHFPRRNRIISGLSSGVLVVEAAMASGSLVTARCALEQGREVFAMPGSVNNPSVKGCHALIRDGACLVENAEQVLEELSGVLVNHQTISAGSDVELYELPNCPNQQHILSLIGSEACHQDEIIARTGMDGRKVSELLFQLELDGFVKSVPGGVERC
ncbi:DNA-processing protein DprA [Sansalvadorimonas sp. 2012CJ34-2]|uniref:DNA-processing protein DprA n=1 Tax=Parendozoicomonas callyspongiae TaxID=2942213 RepID=A0ABT0PAX6_9GAMM|nr:DNA-processing protein DprA [Sansalvadorimonas sp. 2012CJ34-2]MCL6268534.1 DNA-processing protein DprA [Sansalvadorimonas sp. 2012CJ34-2]